MKVSKSESGNIGLIAVAVIVGLVVGFAVGRVMNSNKKNDSNTSSSSSSAPSSMKATALHTGLVTLGVAHMQLTDQAVDAALDSSPNAKAYGAALNQNGQDIGAAVGSVYGKDAETTFDKVWQLHLDQFVNYAVADSKGDANAKSAALSTIDSDYTKPLAMFLAKANPNIDEQTLETALRDHVTMTAGVIDQHVAGKYADEASELKQANSHIADIFSSLSDAIVKQYPSKF